MRSSSPSCLRRCGSAFGFVLLATSSLIVWLALRLSVSRCAALWDGADQCWPRYRSRSIPSLRACRSASDIARSLHLSGRTPGRRRRLCLRQLAVFFASLAWFHPRLVLQSDRTQTRPVSQFPDHHRDSCQLADRRRIHHPRVTLQPHTSHRLSLRAPRWRSCAYILMLAPLSLQASFSAFRSWCFSSHRQCRAGVDGHRAAAPASRPVPRGGRPILIHRDDRFLVIAARLRNDRSLVGGSRDNLGASPAPRLWTITLPYLRPALIASRHRRPS